MFDRGATEGDGSRPDKAYDHQSDSLFNVSAKKHEAKLDGLSRSQLAIMPSQQAIETMLSATETWWTVWFNEYSAREPEKPKSHWMSYFFPSLTTSHPSFISRALLLIATSLQQLPQNYDQAQLKLPLPPQDLMERCISKTSSLVTSDDELVANL